MTQQQRSQLERASEIAQRDGLRAVRGLARDGRTVYGVLARSESRRAGHPVYHLLTVEAGRILCDCYAARAGRICAHRAAVRAELAAEREASRQEYWEDYWKAAR